MNFAERFPGAYQILRLVGLTVGAVVLLFMLYVPIGSLGISADPGDLERWSIGRLAVILVLAGFAVGFGAIVGDAALPEPPLVPVVLAATAASAFGLSELVNEVERYGWLPLPAFIYVAVCSPAFVLGALAQQRLRKRWPKKRR